MGNFLHFCRSSNLRVLTTRLPVFLYTNVLKSRTLHQQLRFRGSRLRCSPEFLATRFYSTHQVNTYKLRDLVGFSCDAFGTILLTHRPIVAQTHKFASKLVKGKKILGKLKHNLLSTQLANILHYKLIAVFTFRSL